MIPGSGRSPGGGHGNPLQYSCLENPHGQRSLAGHSPQGLKESEMATITITFYLQQVVPRTTRAGSHPITLSGRDLLFHPLSFFSSGAKLDSEGTLEIGPRLPLLPGCSQYRKCQARGTGDKGIFSRESGKVKAQGHRRSCSALGMASPSVWLDLGIRLVGDEVKEFAQNKLGTDATQCPLTIGSGDLLVFNICVVKSIKIFFRNIFQSLSLTLLPCSKQPQPLPFREH